MGLIKNLERFDDEIHTLKEAHDNIVEIFKRYVDMKESYYSVIATWILAAKTQESFETFPYFFLNAMKGSGKTRFLKLSMYLLNGFVTTNVTDAVLFREKMPIAIDEAESISSKENVNKHDLLNSGYKKGSIVKRVDRNKEGKLEPESFDPYRPIMIANIEGLDDVLEDRCIKIILEKSFDKKITRRMEMFFLDPQIKKVMGFLSTDSEASVSSVPGNGVYAEIHESYIEICLSLMDIHKHTHTHTHTHTYTHYTTSILDKIEETELLGRDLELWMPMLVIAAHISPENLDNMIESAVRSAQHRLENTMMENKDVVMIGFLNDFIEGREQHNELRIKDMVEEFGNTNGEEEWFNPTWLGRALMRNGLVKKKRRMGKGIEVILNFEKIKEKARQFGMAKDLTAFTSGVSAFTKAEDNENERKQEPDSDGDGSEKQGG